MDFENNLKAIAINHEVIGMMRIQKVIMESYSDQTDLYCHIEFMIDDLLDRLEEDNA